MTKTLANGMLLIVTIIWGGSFPLIRNSLDTIPDTTYILLRFLLATIALLPFIYKRKSKISSRMLKKSFTLGLVLFSVMYLTVNAFYHTTSVNVSFFTGLSIVIVPFIWMFVSKELPKLNQLVCISVSFLGMSLLIGTGSFELSFGYLLCFVLSIAIAVQIILTNIFSKEEDPFLLGMLQIVFCTIFSSLYWAANDFPSTQFYGTIIVALLVTGLLSTALAFTIQTVAQKYTNPTNTAVIFACEPMFGALFSILIMKNDGSHESLTLIQTLGCIMIFFATLLLEDKIIRKLSFKSIKYRLSHKFNS